MTERNKKMDKQKIIFLVLSCLVAVTLWIFVDVTGGELVEIEIKDIPIDISAPTRSLPSGD